MSVRGDRLPPERTLLGIIDRQARRAVGEAQQALAPIVTAQTPRKSGAVAGALRPRVSRTATGAAVTVAPPRGRLHGGSYATVADVMRWVQRGTGIRRQGPGGKRRIRSSRIPPRRLALPGGKKVWSVAGQRANPFMGRIQTLGTPRVQAALEQGARDAARAIEREVS